MESAGDSNILNKFMCVTCGVQYQESDGPPSGCMICEDERQYVGWKGQRWTTLDKMRSQKYANVLQAVEHNLTSVRTVPSFGIGQRAFFVQTRNGNLLWDCVSYIDEKTIAAVRDLGGISAIVISHPHYYSTMVEWSESFDDAPIYIHSADRKWITRASPNIRFWNEETVIPLHGLNLIHLGGHFPGGTVLFWPEGASGRGVVLSGDILQVVMDRRWVSFMYSYPNLIPLPQSTVEEIAARMRHYRYDRLYGAFEGREILSEADEAVQRSARRYVQHLQATTQPTIIQN